MQLIRYKPEFQEPMLALHRSAIEGFILGMSQEQDEADLAAVEDAYLRRRGEFLLGFIGERLMAMGGFKRLSEDLAELRRMRIARDVRGRGYGTLLLRELERRASESGVRTLCLAAARRRALTLEFYRKHGYQETGQGFYGAVETVLFQKTLGERIPLDGAHQSIAPPGELAHGGVLLRFVKVVPGEPSRGLVPYYHFRIIAADGVDVGHINFRVGDTEHVRFCAGHIGFEIAEARRGHGYALRACRAIAPFVASVYDAVTITCDADNHASRRTIERLGGCFIDEVAVPPDDPHYQRGSRRKRRYKWEL